MNHLFLHCRPGFEKECAAEINDLANEQGCYGYSKTTDNSAYVVFITHEPDAALRLIRQLPFRRLIFTRQWFVGAAPLENLSPEDRLTPLLAAARALPQAAELLVETPDTNEGKELSTLGKKFAVPFSKALMRAELLQAGSNWQ